MGSTARGGKPASHASARCSRVLVNAKAKTSAQNHKKDGRAKPISESADDMYQLYTAPDFLMKPQVSPAIQLQQFTAGKGRGLVAKGGVIPGDLLLVSQPVGRVVCGPEGASLRPEQLIPHLQAEGALSDADKARLSLLFDGTPESGQRPISFKDFSTALNGGTGASAKDSAAPKGFGVKAKPAPPPVPVDEITGKRLEDIVRFNCWGIEYADFAAAPLRKQQSHSYIGVWPEFSLLNHSCIPNTQPVLIGDRLLLRAASNIPEGGELTTSYLGLAGGYPVAERRKQLSTTYGFTCNCARCKTESAAPENVIEALERMWNRILDENVVQKAQELIMSTSPEATSKLQQLQQELEKEVAAFEGLLEQHALDMRVRQWLRSSAYATYELLAVCRDEQESARGQVSSSGDQGEASSSGRVPVICSDEQPESLMPLISVISPASDTHLYLALEWLERAGKKYGSGHEKTKTASQACLAAHLMRYGRVPNELLSQLIMARSQVEYNLGRVNLPSPSAASLSAAA